MIRIVLRPDTGTVDCDDCQAILAEHGIIYTPNRRMQSIFHDLDRKDTLVDVMRRYSAVILSHGIPQPDEISSFQQHFILGLGYCPPSLV